MFRKNHTTQLKERMRPRGQSGDRVTATVGVVGGRCATQQQAEARGKEEREGEKPIKSVNQGKKAEEGLSSPQQRVHGGALRRCAERTASGQYSNRAIDRMEDTTRQHRHQKVG